jgi:hypothetical protein
MSRTAVESDIREKLGLVPEFLTEIPDSMIETEWASFKEFELAETAIPNRIGYFTAALLSAVSGSTSSDRREGLMVFGPLSSRAIVEVVAA